MFAVTLNAQVVIEFGMIKGHRSDSQRVNRVGYTTVTPDSNLRHTHTRLVNTLVQMFLVFVGTLSFMEKVPRKMYESIARFSLLKERIYVSYFNYL